MLVLPEKHRSALKEPFGALYPDVGGAQKVLEGRTVISVGDVVTKNLLLAGHPPDVAIIDGVTRRTRCQETPLLEGRMISTTNPAGAITDELCAAVFNAVSDPPAVIFVEGEEDLAVIPAVIAAPDGAAVIYGQPGEGVVIRIIDKNARREAESLLTLFERRKK